MIAMPMETVTVRRKMETNIEVEESVVRTVFSSDVMKKVFSKTNYIPIIDFCLCITSNKCNDHPMDRGCIFLGNGVRKIPGISDTSLHVM